MAIILGFTHRPAINGGQGTFQTNLIKVLVEKKYQIVYPEDKIRPDIIIVIAGTKKLSWLYKCKRKGTKIIHRIDGINWMHRKHPFEVRNFFYGEVTNLIAVVIRRRLADFVIYQSEFVLNWWNKVFHNFKHEYSIIYNGAKHISFIKRQKNVSSHKSLKLICVEGNIPDTAFSNWALNSIGSSDSDLEITLSIVGEASPHFISKYKKYQNIQFIGRVPREEVSNYLRDSDVFVSLEILGACPNSILEGMSYSLPIIGFDSGAVSELVHEAGVLFPLSHENAKKGICQLKSSQMDQAVELIANSYDQYSARAYNRIADNLNIKNMVHNYISIIEKLKTSV